MLTNRKLQQVIFLLSLCVLTAAPRLGSGATTFSSDCGSLAYDEYGSGKPIVLLAGGPGMNPAYMTPVAKILADSGRRAILFHQRGTGKSSDAISCHDRVSVAGAVADIEQLRVHLQLPKLTLLGHSWGGMLAMAYAQEHPGQIAGLVLLDTGPAEQSGFKAEMVALQARLSPADKEGLKAATTDEEREKIQRRAEFADPSKSSLVEQEIPAGEPLWYPEVLKLMAQGFSKWDVTQGVKNLSAPMVLIFGREDPGFSIANDIRSIQPEAKLVPIEHAGHYPWLDNQEPTAKALKTVASDLP